MVVVAEVVPMGAAEVGAADLLETCLRATRKAMHSKANPTRTLQLRSDQKGELNDPAHLGSIRSTLGEHIGQNLLPNFHENYPIDGIADSCSRH